MKTQRLIKRTPTPSIKKQKVSKAKVIRVFELAYYKFEWKNDFTDTQTHSVNKCNLFTRFFFLSESDEIYESI